MGLAPLAACTLALLDDRVDRRVRAGEVGHGGEIRQGKVPDHGLCRPWPQEQALLAQPLGEPVEAELDRAIQGADRLEVLQPRPDLVLGGAGQGSRLPHSRQRILVGHVEALRALEVDQVPQRRLVERQELDLDAGRVGVRRQREARALEGGAGTDRGQQVLHEREMEHLLLRDVDELAPPAPRRLELDLAQALVLAVLHRERGIQVLAHHQLLECGRLAEGPDQRLAMLEDHRRRTGVDTATRREELHQPPAWGGNRARVGHAGSLRS